MEYLVGDNLTVKCREGYRLIGQEVVTCTNTSQWRSAHVPYCSRIGEQLCTWVCVSFFAPVHCGTENVFLPLGVVTRRRLFSLTVTVEVCMGLLFMLLLSFASSLINSIEDSTCSLNEPGFSGHRCLGRCLLERLDLRLDAPDHWTAWPGSALQAVQFANSPQN